MVTCWDSVSINFWVRLHHSDLSVSPNPIPEPETAVSYPQESLDVYVGSWEFGGS